ncbi:hypothetical protein RU639_004052 [Aspergillus parasiticus]
MVSKVTLRLRWTLRFIHNDASRRGEDPGREVSLLRFSAPGLNPLLPPTMPPIITPEQCVDLGRTST